MTAPFGLAFDAADNLYVANYSSSSVRRFASTGTDLGDFATSASLDRPIGLAFDAFGHLLVGSTGGGVIREFSPTGADLGNFADTGSGFMAFQPDLAAVPEPSSLALLGMGIAGILVRPRRRPTG